MVNWPLPKPWWRHQMETFSTLLALCVGNSPVTGEFPTQRPVTWSFDVFFDLRLSKRLSKQLWDWWFETPSRSLWRHFNDRILFIINHEHIYAQKTTQLLLILTMICLAMPRLRSMEKFIPVWSSLSKTAQNGKKIPQILLIALCILLDLCHVTIHDIITGVP